MDNSDPTPRGTLIVQTLAMPSDTNINGDVFGGWILSQMDIAGGILAAKRAHGRVATVHISSMSFIRPVPVGSVVSVYVEVVKTGRTSITTEVEVWVKRFDHEPYKVTEGEFKFVAIDESGKSKPIPEA